MSASITVVGAGAVGTNLATAFARAGHVVRFAARNPKSDKVRAAVDASSTTVVPLAEAGTGADFVVLAVPYAAVAETVTAIGDLGDAVLIDATNAIGVELPHGTESIVDVIAAANPRVTVVKAFNTVGAEANLHPQIGDERLFLPIAGDDGAVDRVRELASEIGFDAVVIGDRSAVVMLENFARLWVHLAFRVGMGREFGFVCLTR